MKGYGKYKAVLAHIKNLPWWRLSALLIILFLTGAGLLLRGMYKAGGVQPYGLMWGIMAFLFPILILLVIVKIKKERS